MSETIDSKVVEMRFDNQQFERGVQTSMNSLGSLKKSLDMNGATQGLERISAAAGKVDLSSIGRAIGPVQVQFSKLEAMAVGALMNIGRRVEMTAEKIAKSLTVEPIMTGFQEYETQINAIQTILANTKSKGTTLDDVNKSLDELNEYADKTIYNFTQMTRNIGTFTAAGVDLETSVSSIKGIANLAAISGSTSQQASTAMYQLSQALAAGKVQLMDWNSVVNAGMGGEVFQNALKRTARNMGTNVDAMIKKYGSFRESLTKGEWLTTEVLTETLSQLSGAYTEADLIAKGYSKDQAAEILDLAQTAQSAAQDVKTFTQLFETLKESAQSGWTSTWEIIVGDFEEAKSLLTNVSNVVGGMLTKSADARNKLLQGWKDAGGRAKLIEGLSNAFEGLLSAIRPIRDAFKSVFPKVTVNTLMKLTDNFVKFTEGMHLTKDEMIGLKKTFKGVFAIFDIIGQALSAVGRALTPLLGNMDSLGETVLGVTGDWGEWVYNLSESLRETQFFDKAIEKIVDGFKNVIAFISPVIDGFKKFFSFVGTYIAMPGFEIIQALLSGIQSRIGSVGDATADLKAGISSFFDAIKGKLQDCGFYEWLEKVKSAAKSFGAWAAGNMSNIFGGIIDAFSGGDFSLVFDAINTLFAGGITVAITKFLKSVTSTFESLTDFKDGIVNVFDGVKGCLEAWQSSLKADILKKIAVAIAILAGALLVLSFIDSDRLTMSLIAVSGLFIDLMGAMKVFGDISGDMKSVTKAISVMTGVSIAVAIMAGALASLSTLPIEGLAVGAAGIVVLTGAIVGAIALLAKMKSEGVKGATSIILFSVAIKIAASAVADLAQLSWDEIGRGLAGFAGVLAAVTTAANFIPKNMIGIGIGLIAVSTALLIMSAAIGKMGGMENDALTKGLTTMGIAIGILAIGLNAMTGTLAGSAALAIAAVALAIMTPTLVVLGALSWSSIVTGLVALAAAFTVIGVAGALLASILFAILGLAAAFALIGVAAFAVGAGLAAAGMGFGAVAAGLVALATLSAGSIGIITMALTSIVSGIAGLIPLIVKKLGEGLIAFCDVIAEGAPAIGNAFSAILKAMIDSVTTNIPAILNGVGVLLDSVLEFLRTYVPKIVAVGFELLLSLLHGIDDNIEEVVSTALSIISNFLDGLASKLPTVIQSGINLMLSFINGMADGIRNNTPAVIAATNNLMDAIIGAVKAWFSNAVSKGSELVDRIKAGIKTGVAGLKQAGKDAIQGFIDGVTSKISSAWTAAKNVGASALNGIKDMLGIKSPSREFAKVGVFADEGLINGFGKLSSKVASSAGNVGESALDAMRGAIGRIEDVVNGEVKDPTIRPVLDLSAVRAGANSIGNLFNADSTVGVMANVSSANAMMNNSIQNGGNREVVSAINKLRGDIGNMGHTTYSINGVTYDDGSNISSAVKTIVRAAKIERRM